MEKDHLSRRLFALAGTIAPVTRSGAHLSAEDAALLHDALMRCAEMARAREQRVLDVVEELKDLDDRLKLRVLDLYSREGAR